MKRKEYKKPSIDKLRISHVSLLAGSIKNEIGDKEQLSKSSFYEGFDSDTE